MSRYVKKRYIYLTSVYDVGLLIDERITFSPNQYYSLRSMYGHDNVECRRMDKRTGAWETYPANGHM